jgi:membrane protein DedA with SNARE-associated domain
MESLADLVARHGYWLVGLAIGLESMGIPLPGETILISAAIYAGATHHLNIVVVLVAAIAGAIIGDNLGFVIGRRFGYPLLVRYGRVLRMTPSRLRTGQSLFRRHGGKVVFFGRFVAVLRALAALMAGINHMPWRRFLAFNAGGAVVWVVGYGMLAYLFGDKVEELSRPAGIVITMCAVIAAMFMIRFVRRQETALERS